MRSMPGISATYSSSSAKSAVVAVVDRAAVGVHVLAEQRHFLHALRGEVGDLGQHVVERPRDFLAARVGHDAEAAVLAAAFHDRDEGARRRRRAPAAGGRTSRSRETRCRPAAGRCARRALDQLAAAGAASAGRTPGRRRARARRSPRLPGSRRSRRRRSSAPGVARFRCFTRPRSGNTFSCAFSRTEQVLNRMTSASSGSVGRLEPFGVGAARRPSCPSRTRSSGSRRCACRAFSFRHHGRFAAAARACSLAARGSRRGAPGRRRRAGSAPSMSRRSDAGSTRRLSASRICAPGDELRRLAVELDVHVLHVADLAALRLLRDGAQLRRPRRPRRQDERRGSQAPRIRPRRPRNPA